MVPWGGVCENSHPANYHSEEAGCDQRPEGARLRPRLGSVSELPCLALSPTVISALWKQEQERGREKSHCRGEGGRGRGVLPSACQGLSERQVAVSHFSAASPQEAWQLLISRSV